MKTPFLMRLRPETIEEIEQYGVKRDWPRHTRIYRAGEPCTGLYLIKKGLVKLYRAAPDGRQQIILVEGAGGALGLVSMIDRGDQAASADTLKPTTTLFLSHDQFLHLQTQHADFRDGILMEMARRFRAAIGLLEAIALKPVSARVATRILELASAHDALDGSRTFRLLLSQDELAHALGASRESIARALGELRGVGIIDQTRSEIRVLDAQALFEWSRLAGAEPSTPLPADL
jgi:CRP/FNR family transcriptional regulator, cyclic AMP receptor protein